MKTLKEKLIDLYSTPCLILTWWFGRLSGYRRVIDHLLTRWFRDIKPALLAIPAYREEQQLRQEERRSYVSDRDYECSWAKDREMVFQRQREYDCLSKTDREEMNPVLIRRIELERKASQIRESITELDYAAYYHKMKFRARFQFLFTFVPRLVLISGISFLLFSPLPTVGWIVIFGVSLLSTQSSLRRFEIHAIREHLYQYWVEREVKREGKEMQSYLIRRYAWMQYSYSSVDDKIPSSIIGGLDEF
jgi:hypothetical protein